MAVTVKHKKAATPASIDGIDGRKAFATSTELRQEAKKDLDRLSKEGKRKTQNLPRVSPPPLKRHRTHRPNLARAAGESPTRMNSNATASKVTQTPSVGSSILSSQSSRALANPTANTGLNHENMFKYREIHGTKSARPAKVYNMVSSLARTRDDDEASTSSIMARSDVSTGHIPKCNQCKKQVSKSFDPLVKCSSCVRYFHDSCRKPPLAIGDDQIMWQCFRCVQKTRLCINRNRPLIPLKPREISSFTLSTVDSQAALTDRPTVPNNAVDKSDKIEPRIACTLQIPSETRAQPMQVPHEESVVHNTELGSNKYQITRDTLKSTPHQVDTTSPEVDEQMHNFSPEVLDEIGPFDSPYLDDLVTASTLHGSAQLNSKPFLGTSDRCERAEIPNTPSQNSSQAQIGYPCLAHAASTEVISGGPTLIGSVESPGQEKVQQHSGPILCPACKKTRILARRSNPHPMCHYCKQKQMNLGNEVSMMSIPATPDTAISHQEDNTTNPKSPQLTLANSALSKEERFGFLFSPLKKKIRAKKVPTDKITGSLHQTLKVSLHNTTDNPSHCSLPASRENRASRPHIEPDTAGARPDIVTTVLEFNASASDTTCRPSIDDISEEVDDVSDLTSFTDEPPDQVGTTAVVTGGSPPLRSVAIAGVPEKSRNHLEECQYSHRELIGIALLQVSGASLTSSEIYNRISDMLPETTQHGFGPSEEDILEILSSHPDFRKETRGRPRLVPEEKISRWTFASQKEKYTWEDLFPRHCPSPAATFERVAPVPSSTSGKMCPEQYARIRRTKDNAPEGARGCSSSSAVEINSNKKAAEILKSLIPRIPVTAKGGIDSVIKYLEKIPIDHHGEHRKLPAIQEGLNELSTSSKLPTNSALTYHPTIVREDLFKAYPEHDRLPSESMTQAEIDKKIEEIKKRPSRKKLFQTALPLPRDHAGIPANMNGASDLSRPVPRGSRERSEDQTFRCESEKATEFEHIFDLPKTPIPMSYEQKLAFRDGTLVNGKLPRPRVVYKVIENN